MKLFSKTRKKKLINSINIAKSLMEEKLNKSNDDKNDKKVEENIKKSQSLENSKTVLRKRRILKRKLKFKEKKLKQGNHT